MNEQRFEQLKQKYQSVLSAIQQSGARLSHLHEQDNKLVIQGEAPSEQAKNEVWNAIKRVDSSYSDVTCELTVNPSLAAPQTGQGAGAAAASSRTYTVQAGDTLSKIAQQFYGSAKEYMKILEDNRDQLNNPDRIQVGQKLGIPS